jgi:ParB family chromosome partitioning protein
MTDDVPDSRIVALQGRSPRLHTGGTMPTLPPDNPVVELELRQLDLSHADLRIVDSQTQARLIMSIEAEGQLLPVVVVRQEQRSVLIDGFARVHALRRLGEDTVQALVLACSEADAMLFCYRQQQGRRPTAIEEAWLVQELHLKQRQPLPLIASGLSRSTSWVSRRLGLVRTLPESVQQLVQKGAIAPHAAMRSLLPLARTNADAANNLAQIARVEQLSSRQIARICAAWRAGDDKQRHKLLEQPRQYLKLDEHVAETQSAASELPVLVRNFETITAIVTRCCQLLRQPEKRVQVGATEALLVGWPRVCRAFRELTQIVEEQTHVELRHQSRDSYATQ